MFGLPELLIRKPPGVFEDETGVFDAKNRSPSSSSSTHRAALLALVWFDVLLDGRFREDDKDDEFAAAAAAAEAAKDGGRPFRTTVMMRWRPSPADSRLISQPSVSTSQSMSLWRWYRTCFATFNCLNSPL